MSKNQCDLTRARQPVANLPERLPRPARVRQNQHARSAIPIRDVQRPAAVAVGRRNLNVQASHSLPPPRSSKQIVRNIHHGAGPRCYKAATAPVNCEDTPASQPNEPAWLLSRRLLEIVPRQIDLISTPQLGASRGH
jgi:hypothetical protein